MISLRPNYGTTLKNGALIIGIIFVFLNFLNIIICCALYFAKTDHSKYLINYGTKEGWEICDSPKGTGHSKSDSNFQDGSQKFQPVITVCSSAESRHKELFEDGIKLFCIRGMVLSGLWMIISALEIVGVYGQKTLFVIPFVVYTVLMAFVDTFLIFGTVIIWMKIENSKKIRSLCVFLILETLTNIFVFPFCAYVVERWRRFMNIQDQRRQNRPGANANNPPNANYPR